MVRRCGFGSMNYKNLAPQGVNGPLREVLQRAADAAGVTYAQIAYLYTHIVEQSVNVLCERRELHIPAFGKFLVIARHARGHGKGRAISKVAFAPTQVFSADVDHRVTPDFSNNKKYSTARCNGAPRKNRPGGVSRMAHQRRLQIVQDADGMMESVLLNPLAATHV